MFKQKILTVITLVVLFLPLFSFAMKPMVVEANYAEEIEVFDNREGFWGGVRDFVQSLTGWIGESVVQMFSKLFSSIVDFFIGLICPMCTVAADDISANPDIPENMKLGALGIAEKNVVAMFEAQPQIDVVAHLANEWVPGHREQAVYASGYDDLMDTGIDVLWSFMRNIAYLGFVIIMIIVGFMIMFRHKIGGQMLVTVGNSIPRIVIGLVLVTFSFAIAGIILDITGIIMRVTRNVLISDVPVHNFLQLFGGTLKGTAATTGTIGAGALLGLGAIALLVTKFTFGLAAILGGIVLLIVLGILFFGAVKLWFTLVKAYLALLLNVIVSPIVIMMGSLPGNQVMITNLFKSILRNAFVFPLAFAIVNLPYFVFDVQRVTFTFPETVFEGASQDHTIGYLMIGVAKIIALFAASQAPQFMKAIIPATATKTSADAAAAVKEGFSKVPVIGGAFK